MMNFVGIVYAQAKLRGIFDVAGFPNKTILVGVPLPVFQPGAEVFHVALPDGDGAFLLALVVDHINQETVYGNRVGSKLHLLGVKTVAFVPGERARVPDSSQTI